MMEMKKKYLRYFVWMTLGGIFVWGNLNLPPLDEPVKKMPIGSSVFFAFLLVVDLGVGAIALLRFLDWLHTD